MNITIPAPSEGETYAGLILNPDGTLSHHLILLADDAEKLTWEKAKEWAKTIGGDLPTRQEQALLYANCKAQFKSDWYWSGEMYASGSSYAWCQDFDYGGQGISSTNRKLRARAIRRVYIKEQEPC
jgi:hypothetical protein